MRIGMRLWGRGLYPGLRRALCAALAELFQFPALCLWQWHLRAERAAVVPTRLSRPLPTDRLQERQYASIVYVERRPDQLFRRPVLCKQKLKETPDGSQHFLFYDLVFYHQNIE